MLLPIVMAGGSGTRLWPLSRQNYPKQFLALNSQYTMLQDTILRLSGLEHEPPMLICNEEHRFLAAEQVRQLHVSHGGIFLEPVGRNTAPAIALAALKALEQGQDPVLLVLAADHVIDDTSAFHACIRTAEQQALENRLVTFGIVPTHAETGYGYIKRGDSLRIDGSFRVDAFFEKPDFKTASDYFVSGQYYWNSGMFMFKASRYLEELEAYCPDIVTACRAAMAAQVNDLDFVRIDKAAFEACPEDSIDYAVMEKTQDAVVVAMDAGWNDLGGFSALWETSAQCANGNAFKGDVKAIDTVNTLAISEDKLVATVGVDGLVIINTKDAVLVAHKDKAQDVKHIVNQLKQEGRQEVTFHREVFRPWGKYDAIDSGDRFQVKRITVKPGARLSLQMHHHRAEHWIVVSGTARVNIDDKQLMLTENESTYIPIGATHSLENPGKVDLELIEVQSGSYLGEDDIVRFEDIYGRADSQNTP